MNADELSSDIIKAIKRTYQHRQIEIVIQEIEDETEYLLSSPANKEHLLRAIENIKNRTNLVQVKLEDL
jgi:antitoxin YefM